MSKEIATPKARLTMISPRATIRLRKAAASPAELSGRDETKVDTDISII